MRRAIAFFLLVISLARICQANEIPDTVAGADRPWIGRVLGAGLGLGVNASVTELLKHIVRERRPDGSDSRSFPSRHTSYAFALASVASHELNVYSPLWTVGAHAAANAVAMQRVLAGRHYPGDVLAGAVLGIFSSEFGYGLSRLMFPCGRYHMFLHPVENLSALSVSTAALIPLRTHRRGHRTGCGVESSLRVSFALGDQSGVGASFRLRSQPVYTDGCLEGFLNGAAFSIDGYACKPLRSWLFDARLSAGLMRYFDRPDGDIRPWSPLVDLTAGVCRRLARSLSIGARLGYSLSDVLGSCGAMSVALVTKADF